MRYTNSLYLSSKSRDVHININYLVSLGKSFMNFLQLDINDLLSSQLTFVSQSGWFTSTSSPNGSESKDKITDAVERELFICPTEFSNNGDTVEPPDGSASKVCWSFPVFIATVSNVTPIKWSSWSFSGVGSVSIICLKQQSKLRHFNLKSKWSRLQMFVC